MATGKADEVLALGPRGEAKTISALVAMAAHAKIHEERGYKLPVPWVGITDTFNSHREKTHDSLKKPFWEGAWQVYEGGHRAVFKTNKAAVVLSLFGIENRAALDRARRETACTWGEEIAPTTEGQGVPEDAIDMSITSQRVPTHAPVLMLTSNYPEETYWLWQRFRPRVGKMGLNPHPTDSRRICYQIPKGDNKYITEAQRQQWYDRLKDRPELVARLLDGRPAVIHRGKAVAVAHMQQPGGAPQPIGFNEAKHVAAEHRKPVPGYPIFLGQDGGHTPATTIGQEINGVVRVYASLCIERGGMRQQMQYNVKPWLRRYAPWCLKNDDLLLVGYDPSMPDDESDTERADKNPAEVGKTEIGGTWEPGPVDWESRKGTLYGIFNRAVGGEPALQIDPGDDTLALRQALNGQWYYKTDRFGQVTDEKPAQHNHPWEDYGQSLCYMLCRMLPELDIQRRQEKPIVVESGFDPRVDRGQPMQMVYDIDPRRWA